MRFMTAGESHGKGLVIIIDGVPAHLKISKKRFDARLCERQKGYGRGGRQKIESDTVEIIAGIRHGETTGAPLAFMIKNLDSGNWAGIMSPEPYSGEYTQLNVPRPGHADLAGGMKYGHKDFRNVLERASARETAVRVLAGVVGESILEEFGITAVGFAVSIGRVVCDFDGTPEEIKKNLDKADPRKKYSLGMASKAAVLKAKSEIDNAINKGDTLGGVIKVVTSKLPPGLGSYTQWDRKLDAKIAMGIMSLQAVKGVEFGAGFGYALKMGSKSHDMIYRSPKSGYFRKTNNSGGIEGGMTNGEAVTLKAAVKPIATVRSGVESVNALTGKKVKTVYERSDTCAVPAAALVACSICLYHIADAFCEKFGSDSMAEISRNYKGYLKEIREY